MPTSAAHGEPPRKKVSGICSATRGLEPCTSRRRRRLCTALAVIHHAHSADGISNLSILPCLISLLQTRACRAPSEVLGKRPPARQEAKESGARHPQASPRLGRTFSARGHTEREDAGVKGRRDPRSRARRSTRRAGRETLRRTECARRTMIPKIVYPQFVRGSRVFREPNPFGYPDRKIPRRSRTSYVVRHPKCESGRTGALVGCRNGGPP
jgi:hypothetical protein